MHSPDSRRAAVHIGEQRLTLAEISARIHVPKRTLQQWGLTEPGVTRACVICGAMFEWKRSGANLRAYCYSTDCKRAIKNERKSAWQKTEAGKKERRRNRLRWAEYVSERNRERTRERRAHGRLCGRCGLRFWSEVQQDRMCSEYCREEAKRVAQRRSSVKRYWEDPKGRNKKDHEQMSVPTRIKKEHSRWKRRVRARFGEPTPKMWALLYELRRLRRDVRGDKGVIRLPELADLDDIGTRGP